jgi:hypothetical protein
MKRRILYVIVMLMTFAFGAGVGRSLSPGYVDNIPQTELDVVLPPLEEPGQESVVTVTPVAAAPSATPILIRDYDPEKFTPWGVLYIMGDKPKAFVDFDAIEMGISGPGTDEHAYLGVSTGTPGSEYDSAQAIFALVTERRLFFVTSKTHKTGIEYRFEGQFLRTDFDTVGGKNIPVLRGTLTKSKDGRTIAEHTFNFRLEHLGC